VEVLTLAPSALIMPRERTYRTEAIVLRRRDFGEADRLLTLYTRDRGKIRVIAKGARKPQSRKTGHVELFMRTRFLIAEARNLDIITQAEMVEAYPALREDLVRTTYASYAVELLDRFTPEEDRNTQLYDLLAEGLRWFAATDQPLLVARFYELHLLQLAGFRPQLFQCVGCGEPIAEQDQLSAPSSAACSVLAVRPPTTKRSRFRLPPSKCCATYSHGPGRLSASYSCAVTCTPSSST
jgi:DNA repair protein RecO (recombination protein O)